MLELVFLFVRGFLLGFGLDAISPSRISSCVTNSKLPSVPTRLRDSAVVIGPYGSGSIGYGRRRGGTY